MWTAIVSASATSSAEREAFFSVNATRRLQIIMRVLNIRPISVLRLWISECLAQAKS